MRIRRVVDHQLDHHLHPALMRRVQKQLEILQRPVRRIHIDIVRNVIPIVPQRGREEGKQPYAGHPKILQIVQPRQQPAKVADPVPIRVHERSNV
jgi:hypothetical protein